MIALDDDDILGDRFSPLDRPLTLTRFRDAKATRKEPLKTTLRDFAPTIQSTRAPSKDELPWLKLAKFGDVATPKGSLRHDANLAAIEGIEGDHDAGTMTVAQAIERLKAADVAAVVYTTPSHTRARPRWRALAPTSEALNPDERDALCARLNGALNGALAPESFTRSQAYYFGAVGNGAAHEVRLTDGRPIDWAGDLDAVAIGRRASEPDDDTDDSEDFRLYPDWERITLALTHIPADDRDMWLRVGMALHAESGGRDDGFEAWSAWSKQSAKFDAKDQRRTWASFRSRERSVALGTIFHLAESFAPKGAAAVSHLTFLTPAECEISPSRGYVVKGLMAPGDVGCIFGAPGAGKSLIAPHLGYAVAQGQDAFGMRTKVGEIFYVAAEDPLGMRGRVTSLKIAHGDAPGFVLVEGVSDLLSADSPDLSALADAVERRRPALIFIDTLAMAFPGLEENSAEPMGRVISAARSLASHGAAVVLIHHDTKAEGSTPRGHSLLNGALDFALHVKRDEFGVVRATLTKNRNGPCDRDIAFRIDTRSLGTDEDGDQITAALVDEFAPGAAKGSPKLSASANAALVHLRCMLEDRHGQSPDMSGSVRVSEADWRRACVDGREVSASDNPDSRQKAFTRAYQTLAREGLLSVNEAGVCLRGDDYGDAFEESES